MPPTPDELAAWSLGAEGWWGGDEETPMELLARMAALPPDKAEVVPVRHPRMLLPDTVQALEAASPSGARGALELVRKLSDHAYAGTFQWPVGMGPLEALAARVRKRMLALDHAILEASEVGRRSDLIAPYARALASFAVLQAHEGNPDPSLELSELLLAASETAPGTDRIGHWTARHWSTGAYIEIARANLSNVPDDRLYWKAHELADEMLARSHADSPEEEAAAWSQLGCFLLDTYVGDKDIGHYEGAYQAWQGRRRPSPPGAPPEERPMPEPVAALREAVAALRESADRGGTAAGWKAYVQAQYSLVMIDPDAAAHGADHAQRVKVAREAISHLDPVRHADKLPFVRLILDGLETQDASTPPRTEEPLAALAERLGERSAITTGIWRLQKAIKERSPDVEAIGHEIWLMARDHADEALRGQVFDANLNVLRGGLPPGMTSADGPLQARIERLEGMLSSDSPTAHANALLGLAATSGGTNEEGRGLRLVGHAVALDPDRNERRLVTLGYLVAGLHYGEACNLGMAERLPEAIGEYGTAAAAYAACGLPSRARQCIERLGASAITSPEAATAAIIELAKHGVDLERALDEHSNVLIADTLRHASAQLDGEVAIDLPLLRDQVAKGLLFASATASPSPLTLDDHGRQLLQEVAYLEAHGAANDAGAIAESALDREDMLASFVAPSEATPGSTPTEELINLRRSFDEHLTTVRYSAGDAPPLIDVASLQQLLDPRTVLITLYLAAHRDGGLAVQSQAFTADTYAAALVPLGFPSSQVLLKHEGITLTQSPIAIGIARLRRQIVEEPMFGEVDDSAFETLSSDLPRWFGPFADKFQTWEAAGLDHLVVWPHGPLHNLPWHLFGVPGRDGPIADHWTVTVLPTLGPLLRPAAPPGNGLIAVACADGGLPFGLRRAEELPAQVDAVAALFGSPPIHEPTPKDVLALLPGARYIHLAAHGSHVEEAPAFHCVYLTQEDGSEGRLFAYEVAQLDLRGVELVTLSACESALGRFDLGDNLRGLPAALLAAGASSVVGAMWPLAEPAANTFFTTLYAQLAVHRGRLAAYREAQTTTRDLHPEYRDWGAMSYIGDWR